VWMCGVKVADRFMCNELRDTLGIDGIITVLERHRLRWRTHVLRKDDEIVWTKKPGL